MIKALGLVLATRALLACALAEKSPMDWDQFTPSTYGALVETSMDIPGASLQIRFQPRNTSALRGGLVVFGVFATADATVSYQWFHDGKRLEGATESVLQIPRVGDSDLGVYTVKASAGSFSLESDPATLVFGSLIGLTIHPAAELEAFFEDGKFYQIQFSEDLVTWDDQGSVFQGAGATRFFLRSTATLPGGFYRIKVTDAVPGGPGPLAGRNFTFATGDGVLHLIEFSLTTNTFRLTIFGQSRTGYDGTYVVSSDAFANTQARLQISMPPPGSGLIYTMKFRSGATGSVDLVSAQRDIAPFVPVGNTAAASGLQSKTLNLTITKGSSVGAFQFTFADTEYIATHGSDGITGGYSYARDGAIGDLTIRHPDTDFHDSYFLIFTSSSEIILRGFQRRADGSVVQVEGTGSLR